jgi:protein-L-isoaspartate(D-aspartate) O-methyltransferase
VLEVGAGSGFMAALMAHQAGRVISLEIHPGLARMATEHLCAAGIVNAEVIEADGSEGRASEGPFDAIVLSGSVASVPACFFEQLQPGGRLVAIVGEEPIMRARLYTRSEGGMAHTDLFDTVAPRLLGFPEPSRFRF